MLYLHTALKPIVEICYPAPVELTNNDPTLTLDKQFLAFNLTSVNITDY